MHVQHPAFHLFNNYYSAPSLESRTLYFWCLCFIFLNYRSEDIATLYTDADKPTLCSYENYQFDEGPKGPKLSWDYTSETSKNDTGS